MSRSQDQPASRPIFVAYVYPGWHPSPYRPTVDEWELLENFAPYFEGHQPPPQPRDGRYDDSLPETASQHIRQAQAFGLSAFTYFLYFDPPRFVLSEPIDAAFSVVSHAGEFMLSLTWCIRLPHATFPITREEKLDGQEDLARGSRHCVVTPDPSLPSDQIPIENLSIADVERILGPELFAQLKIS